MADKRIEALIALEVDVVKAVNSLGNAVDALERFEAEARRADGKQLDRVANSADQATKSINQTSGAVRELNQQLEEAQKRSDFALEYYGTFGDVGTGIRDVGGGLVATGGISPEVEKQLIKVADAFDAVEGAGRLVADGQLLLSKVFTSLATASMAQVAMLGGLALAVGALIVTADTGIPKINAASGSVDSFFASFENVPVEKLDKASLANIRSVEELEILTAKQNEYLATLQQQEVDTQKIIDGVNELDTGTKLLVEGYDALQDVAQNIPFIGQKIDDGPLDKTNNKLKELSGNIDTVANNVELLNSAYVRNQVAINMLLDESEVAGAQELQYQNLLNAAYQGNVSAIESYMTSVQNQVLANSAAASVIEEQLDDLIAAGADAEQIKLLTDELDRLHGESMELTTQIAEWRDELIEVAEATNIATQRHKEYVENIENFSDTMSELADVDSRINEILADQAEDAEEERRNIERQRQLTQLDEEKGRLEERLAEEQQQEALQKIIDDGNAERLETIAEQRDALKEFDKNYQLDALEAQREFNASLEQDEINHRRRLQDIARNALRAMEDAEFANDVVAFIAAQTDQKRQLEDEATNQDRGQQDAIRAFNLERDEALRAYQQRRQDLITSHQQELVDLNTSINQQLQAQRDSYSKELSETEIALKQLDVRKRALEAQFAREDEKIRRDRNQAIINAELELLRGTKSHLEQQILSFNNYLLSFGMSNRPARPRRGGYQDLPLYDDGGIVDKPTIGRLAWNGKPEAVIPLEKGRNFGLGTSITIEAPQISIGSIGENVSPRQVQAEISAALDEFSKATINGISAALGRT